MLRRHAYAGTAAGVLLLLVLTAFFSYRSGARHATLREQVGQLDKARSVAAETSAALSAKVDSARAKSDTAGRRAVAAVKAAKDFPVSPVPTRRITPLQNPAKTFDSAYVDSLILAVASRDVKIALDSVATEKLQTQVTDLLLERPAFDARVAGLRGEIQIGVDEINLLKSAKTPRFGFKAGFIAGATAVTAAVIVVKKLTP